MTSCDNPNSWKSEGLNGNVKNYLVRYYKAEERFGKWEKGDIENYGHMKVNFDKDGLHQEIEYYDYDMDLVAKSIPFRKNGEKIEETVYNEFGKLQQKYIFKNISGNEKDFELFDSENKKIAYGKYIYDNKYRTTKYIFKSIQNNIENETYATLYEYDNKGNMILLKKNQCQRGNCIFCKV